MQENDVDICFILNLKSQINLKPSKSFVKAQSIEIRRLWSTWESLFVINGILYFERLVHINDEHLLVLVAPKEVRSKILKELHNSKVSGHLGRERTLKAVKSRFYWPGITSDVATWCRECSTCTRGKPGPGLGIFSLHQFVVGAPLDMLEIDIVGTCPITENNNEYIIVMVDYYAKWTEAFSVPNRTALTVADKFVVLVDVW